MEAARARLIGWVKSRRGYAAGALALIGAVGSVHNLAGVVFLPFTFLVYLAFAAGLVFLAARFWESKTAPRPQKFTKNRSVPTQGRRLREDGNARLWSDHGGFLFEKRYFFTATGLTPTPLLPALVANIHSQRHVQPVPVVYNAQRKWWAFGDAYFWENAGYTAQDLKALLRDRERRQDQELRRAHMMLNAESSGKQQRQAITKEMRRLVYERDGGACAECGGQFNLQYDHVIPVALGGATSIDNLQLLCQDCNLEKSASI